MRSIYRNKLIQFVQDQARGGPNGGNWEINQIYFSNVHLWWIKDKPIRIGYDMNAREELIRSYNEKEISLTENLEKDKRLSKNLKMEIKGDYT